MAIHELGHNMGLSHGGFEEFNGKPNYVSIMNYGFPSTNAATYNGGNRYFSRNDNAAGPLNPEYLCEMNGMSPGTNAKVNTTTAYFFKTSGSAGVDWNRDDIVSGCGTNVTAMVNWFTRRGPGPADWTRTSAFSTNRTDLPPTPNTTIIGTPAFAAAPEGANDTRAYVFYPLIAPTLDYIKYRSAVFPDGKCANPVTSFLNACTTFVSEQSTSIRGQAVSAATFTHNGQQVVFIAVRNSGGALRVYRSSALGSALSFTFDQELVAAQTPAQATGEPAMVVADNKLWVVWLEPDPNGGDAFLKWNSRTTGGTWSGKATVGAGTGYRSSLSPTLARSPTNGRPYLLMARAVQSGGNTINNALSFLYATTSNTWRISGAFQLDDAVGPNDVVPLDSATEPGLAWHAANLDAPEGAGGWLIATTRPGASAFNTEMNYFDGHTDFGGPDNSTNPDLITGTLDFPALSNGVALFDDALLRHVQGAYIRTDGTLRLMPYADGIFPYALKDHDDYAYLKVGPCRSLVGDHCQPMVLPPHYPPTSTDDDCSWGAP